MIVDLVWHFYLFPDSPPRFRTRSILRPISDSDFLFSGFSESIAIAILNVSHAIAFYRACGDNASRRFAPSTALSCAYMPVSTTSAAPCVFPDRVFNSCNADFCFIPPRQTSRPGTYATFYHDFVQLLGKGACEFITREEARSAICVLAMEEDCRHIPPAKFSSEPYRIEWTAARIFQEANF